MSSAATPFLSRLLGDARLPSGAHVQSAGLEPALIGGLAIDDLDAFLRMRLNTTGRIEAGVAVIAAGIVRTEPEPDRSLERLFDLDAAWAARTPIMDLRRVSRLLGRGLLRITSSIFPSEPVPAAVADTRPGVSRAVATGIFAGLAGIDARDLVRCVFYDEAMTVASALLKLEPTDPLVPIAKAVAACAAQEPNVVNLARMNHPSQLPAPSSPLMDQWAFNHVNRKQRLYRA
jgi:urease accessory protein